MSAAMDLGAPALELWCSNRLHATSWPSDARRLTVEAGAAVADQLFGEGVRAVRLPRPIDSGSAADIPALALVRDLTALGVAVDWRVRLGDASCWRQLSHLYPPSTVHGRPGMAGAGVAAAWRERFYLGMLLYRVGPGFVQVRDWRAGGLQVYTIDEGPHLRAIAALLGGCDVRPLPPATVAELRDAGLIHGCGDQGWWLPYRVRRWPRPPMAV